MVLPTSSILIRIWVEFLIGQFILEVTFSIRLGPMRWVPTAHCAGRRGLNLLTAVSPVELAQCLPLHFELYIGKDKMYVTNKIDRMYIYIISYVEYTCLYTLPSYISMVPIICTRCRLPLFCLICCIMRFKWLHVMLFPYLSGPLHWHSDNRKHYGPRLNIKTVLSTYGDFHVKDKTAVRTSYL